jgi:hypothetical protein
VAPPRISAEDLQFAGLSDPALVTPLNVEGKFVDHTITLIGAYADPARIVLILQVKPNDAQPTLFPVTDDQGELNASGGGGLTPSGNFVWHVDAGPRVGADGIAHLKATIRLELPGLPLGTTIAQLAPLVLKFDLPVHKSALLPVGPPFQLGKWPVTIKMLEVTPATVHLEALFEGASSDDLLGPSHQDLITLLDETCTQLRQVTGGATIAERGYTVNFQWVRLPSAATYQLRFHVNGATRTIALKVPASGTI